MSAGAVALALGLSAVVLAGSGFSVGEAFANLWDGALGSVWGLANTLLNAIPLLLTGLAVAVGFRGGLFNIGVEGQMYVGALASAVVGLAAGRTGGIAPAVLAASTALAAAAAAGAAWGWIAGALKAKTGAHEVITTIMLNYVAILLTTYLVKAYLKEPGPVDQTPVLPPAAWLPEIVPGTRLSVALFVALAAVVACEALLRRTVFGYALRLVGANPDAAAYAGIPVARTMGLTMALSGALAGLAGAALVQGVLHRFITGFSPGYGFTGIAVAVLGRNVPWAVLLAAILFGALQAGGTAMQLFARIPADLMTVVQGLVILLVAAPSLIEMVVGARRRAAKRAATGVAALSRPGRPGDPAPHARGDIHG